MPVELDALAEAVAARTAPPFLVSVGEAGPKVVAVAVTVAADGLHVDAGPGTRRNVQARPAVTLLWPDEDDRHCLLVDGTATVSAEDVIVMPTSAILHVRR